MNQYISEILAFAASTVNIFSGNTRAKRRAPKEQPQKERDLAILAAEEKRLKRIERNRKHHG